MKGFTIYESSSGNSKRAEINETQEGYDVSVYTSSGTLLNSYFAPADTTKDISESVKNYMQNIQDLHG